MKNLKIAVLLLFVSATIQAQDIRSDQVPSKIQTTFSKAYANATDIEWEKSGEHYKVEFEIRNMDHDVWYDAAGNLVKSKIEIGKSELPENIASIIKTKYADYKIDSVEVHQKDSVKTYEIEIEKGWTKERKLVLDSSGEILSDLED